MDDKQFRKLLKQSKADEEFFHDLVFDPAKAVDEIDYLDDDTKAAIAKIDPEAVLRGVVAGGGLAADCGVTVQCTQTCTHTSSLQDQLAERGGLAAADCGVTVQCGSTCGHTSSLAEPMGDFAGQLKTSIERRIKG